MQNCNGKTLGIILVTVGVALLAAVVSWAIEPENIGNTDVTARMLEPTGKVNLRKTTSAATAPQNAPTAAVPPETLFNNVCSACHATGAMNAPKLGDKSAWAARIKQGKATLVQHAMSGIRMMPPKGGCANCSETEISGVVEYMMKAGE
jgi:cytochrome c5